MAVDCVIIGVNCANTLAACIESVCNCNYPSADMNVWYVDGGSTDGSINIAGRFEAVNIIALTPSHPTPGLGRNAGWRAGTAEFVQFLDSDTVLDPNWLTEAVQAITQDKVGAVRGNRSERHPDATMFNWIADLEWNAPPGKCDDFGGDVMIRRDLLKAVDGYNEELVGGEDPELSRRIRDLGWNIVQLDRPMTTHDLAMTGYRQYWRRNFRSGYGFAAVTDMHRNSATSGFWHDEMRRIRMRGGGSLALFTLGIVAACIHPAFALLTLPAMALLFYPRLMRVEYFMRAKNLPMQAARFYAWHCSVVVLPQLMGVIRYHIGKRFGCPLRNKRQRLKTGQTS